jgi:hypothetical protein
MTDWQFVFLVITFIITIFNLIFTIVSFKVDWETDEEYKEKFSIISNTLKDYRIHKEKVEKVLNLDKVR